MMKAFSFLTILESLSKKLSILRTKMHSDDLRVNHGTITRVLRVSRPFSHTSFGASFDLSRRASHFAAILTILFTIGVGQAWGEDYSSLNYNGEENLPTGYTYYGKSAGEEDKESFSVTTCDGVKVFDVTATGGAGTYNKRCIEFTITEDCSVEIKLHTGNAGRVFQMYNGSEVVVKEVTLTSKGEEYTFSYDFKGATKQNPQIYSFSGSGSKTYISKITFTSSSSGGGETPDPDPDQPGTGGEVDSDGCTKIFWFANAADATAAGVENNTSTFSNVKSGSSDMSGTIEIDGKEYEVTGRGDNGKPAIEFTVPEGKTATLYGLASSSGSSARTITLKSTNYEQTQQTAKSSSKAAKIEFTDMSAGTYKMSWSDNGAISFLCLKLCPTCADPSLSYTNETVTKTFGDAAFTNTLTNTNGVAVTYSSSDENVATVANNGQVTIVGAGTTTIKATWEGNATYCEAEASYTLTVAKANISPTLTYNPNSLAIGGTANPTINGNTGNGTVTYSSSNTSVATVNQNGVVTAVAEGTATITATIDASDDYNGGTATCQISVHCTAPTSVVVTPTNEFGWRYSIGETISLKATYEGGAGTPSYQWQKFIGDKWTNIDGATAATYTKTNCTTDDGGSYRCVVSTGTNCSYESEGYFVRVFTLNGGYTTDGEWTAHKIDWTDENTGVVTISLPVSKTYYFKVTDNDGKWFGYGDASNYIIQPWQADCGTSTGNGVNANIRLFTGPEGDYTFTINIEHAQENSPYVNIKVDYPEVTHPVAGYAYINKWWDCYVHYWEGASNALTTWGSDPKINDDRYVNICGTDYWYFPVIETYTNFIAKDNAGNPANTTGDQSTTNHSGQNITHNGSAWVWQEFSTYSIKFNGNSNTGGSMTDVTGITCDGSATLTQNAFTRTGYTFAGWATSDNGEKVYDDKATISNITSNITLYAKWTPNANTAYTVKHYKQQLDETYSATPDETQNLTGTTAASVTPAVKSYEGFTAPSTQTVTIAADGSTVVNYQYTRNSYKVTWKPAGGNWNSDTNDKVVEHKYGAKIIAPEKPSRTGFEFVEWAPTYVANETTMPANDVTYTAQWREIAQTYTITYDINRPTKYENDETETGFPAETTVTVNAGSTITLPNPSIIIDPNPVYTAKWKDASDNEYIGGAEITPTGDMTLTAYWTPQSWPIRYYESFDGTNLGKEITGLTPNQYTYGVATSFCADAETIVQKANKTGYTWLGWWNRWDIPEPQNPITKADAGYSGEFSLFAKWEEESVTPDPDLECETTTITYTLVTPNNNTATQNVSGTDKITTLTGAIAKGTATANTGEINNSFSDYSVRYGASSGSDNTDNGVTFTFTVPIGYVFKPSAITSELMCYGVGGNGDNHYYQFVGELSSENGQIISGNVYPSNSDGASAAIVYTINDVQMTGTVTLRLNAVKLGGEWQSFRIKSPITITGQLCETQTYTISYNANGGSGTMESTTNVVAANTFTREGYTFAGWNTTEDGTGTSYSAGDYVSSDLELYAQWTENTPAQTYTITYNCDGATSGCPENTQATNLPNPLPSTITKTNFVFEGWYTDEAKTIPAVAGAALTANTTLYAKWADMDIINEDVCWNISDDAFKNLGTITTRTEVNNLHIVGASNANITVDAGNKTIAGTSFTHRLKYGGKGTPFARHLWFSVMGNCNITIYMMSANNQDTRHLAIATGTFDNVVQTFDASPTPSKNTYNYTGGPTTIYLYPNDNGLNIYQICVEYLLPSCTTPELSSLTNQTICEGGDADAWTAAITNELAVADGEKVSYQWTKRGNATILSEDATYQLNDVTEAMGGTYVLTAIVSADGKSSATASTEVTLTVIPATEVPTITASASTVYAGNSVKLTATCASSGVTYQWYTYDAEGTKELEGATNNAYTLASAGDAGTYYYKVIVTGDGTHSCGTAEAIFPLVVSSSNSGQTTCAEIAGQFASGVYNLDTDFVLYGVDSKGNLDTGVSSTQGTSRCGGEKGWFFNRQRFAVTFPVDVVSFSFMGYQSNDRTIENVKTTAELLSEDTEYQTIKYTSTVTKENNCQTFVVTPENTITAGTIVWIDLSNALNISEICYVPVSTADCTDPQVTATVDNATICAGTENVTFTATNYADGATLQWQKKNGNNWEKVIETTSATYTISSVTTEHTGKYRVIAQNVCKRISEEVTLTVLTAPTFNTFADEASVMKGNALAISDVQATGATGYAWYKSADNSLDAKEDTKVGTSKDLLLAAASIPEAADQTFYLFCVASNSCGSVTSNAITVTVTPFVEEECATKGNEGDAEFGFEKESDISSGNAPNTSIPCWKSQGKAAFLTYTAPEGKYFSKATVNVLVSSGSKAAYGYSTNGGTTWTYADLTGLTSSLADKTINLPANVNAFRIGRNFDPSYGVTKGTFYLRQVCFEYTDACTETTLTAGFYNNEYNISTQMDFVEPTFTLKSGENTLEGQTLTYTSSNTAIATVDEDGNVTFEGMTGTVTITATFAGGEINETEYCACQGSYTITVGCKDQAPKIVAAAGTNLNGCNNSITLEAKMQDGTAFADGTFQWYRDGEAIEGATSASYTVVRAGTYTVSRTYTCTTMSSNSAVVTNKNVEPKVERLTPFQYYHVNKDYSNQMKNRHLFAVTSYGTLDGKRYHLTATRNGETLNLSSSTAFFTIPSSDNAVDTVMIDLNELTNKYAEGDEIVITCAPINNCNTASAITASITIHVIGDKPTLALICSGANGEGTRDTKELVVGGDFLTGYNKADLCQQTGNKTFDANTEWGFYTELKEKYIVTPVNGYAEFNKLNYEPFDILLLTDYPKASKSEAAQKLIDDMAELCDYRPLLSFKTHFQSDKCKDANGQYKYTKWVKKGFTTAPVVPAQTATYVNIVCYAHPMFNDINEGNTGEHSNYTFHDADDPNQLVYHMLSEGGYESVKEVKKGIQGFELAAADNFVTIGLIHNAATAAIAEHDGHTHVKWTAGDEDRLLVAMAERQTNIEARMMLFSLNAGAQSLQTEGGRLVILKCLEYLLQTDPLQVADCRFTFDNGEGAQGSEEKWENGEKPHDYQGTGYQGDGLWSTAANWGPDYNVVPGRNNDVRIAAPCIVDAVKTKVLVGDEEQFADAYFPEVLSIHITKDGSLTIPANSSLTARSTILRADEDGNVYPTNVEDISLGSNAGGNASLILNNERGDTKAGVAMYSKAKAGTGTTWQYIGTPHSDVSNATYNYYNSWIYSWNPSAGWEVVPTGGAVYPWVGYCITHPEQGHTYWMEGTLVETTTQEIEVPSNSYQIIGNSWTAPIQIANFEATDFEDIETKSIYLFNTGTDPEGDNSVTQNATDDARYAPGTYIVVPINAAEYTGNVTQIPSMQGFYVANNSTTSAGTLHLDYERHVRAPRKNTPSGPMHAPARRVAADNEPQVAKLLVRGKRYDDKLVLLEREDFTRGYDSGWDGDKWDGGPIPPTIWAVNEIGGADAVAAIPEYEGTVIGFRAGEDSEYTIHFDYDGMEDALYLLDTDTQIYTRVLKGNSYTFTCTDKAEHNRFILTRKAPQIATGTDHINTGENAKAVKFIKDDKIFIFVNGMLYDATGKMVIR